MRDRERPTAGRTNTWSGGFQGEVTVRNDGSSALTGWAVGLNLAPGRSISSLCNGAHGYRRSRHRTERPGAARRRPARPPP
ncbi:MULTISPECIES: cellulose binding domain-containing protein [Streptomyces]|uniref:cellulose binding domain-containing protein n=1 Tax=Streptomyces TaxID=1883 RepID=UPI0035ABA4F6